MGAGWLNISGVNCCKKPGMLGVKLRGARSVAGKQVKEG